MKNRVRDVILRRSAFIIMLLLILGAVALLRIISTHRDVEDVAEIDLPLIEVLTQIETNQLEQSINFERAVRYAQDINRSAFALQSFQIADSTFRYLAKLVDQDLRDADVQVEQALKSTNQEAQKIKLKGLLMSVKKLEADHTSYENHALVVMRLLEEGRLDEASLLAEKVEEEEDQFNKQVEGVLMRHEMFTEALVKIVEQEEVISMEWVTTLTLVFVILSLIAVYTFSYKLWRPLEDIREGASRLGSGDFETKLKLRSNSITEDLVYAFNSMADRLKKAQNEINRFINFSYRTSHDLKAPIENLGSLLDMLDRDKLSTSHYDTVLNNAKGAVKKLANTVGALNEFNRVRENLGTKKEVLEFESVLKEVASNLITQIKESEGSIKKDFEGCPKINYPKSHLKSIVQNLLSNSLKYRNPDHRLVIEIKTFKSEGHTYLMIRDNGLGFDAIKSADEMLKPFVRLHSHTEGTGLGMHIIKTILDYHKGEIKIESEPKKGARFTLRLN